MAKEKEHKIHELQQENRRLKHEVRSLKLELELLQGKFPSSQKDHVSATFEKQAQNESLFSKKRYFSYIYEVIRRTSIFRLYTRMLHGIRRFNLIRITLGILGALILALQSGALFVVSASVFVVSLPFTFLVTNATFMLTFFHTRKINRINRERMGNMKIQVFFPPKSHAFSVNSYFGGMVEDYAQRENTFCVIVSPYFWSSRGLHGRKGKPYIASRLENENILLVRRHYYFTLKKRVFPPLSENITEIY